MSDRRHAIISPDLDLGDIPVVVSLWHVRLGAKVMAGDRILELHAGEVVLDVSSPASGTIVEKSIAEEAPVQAGMTLGWIEREA